MYDLCLKSNKVILFYFLIVETRIIETEPSIYKLNRKPHSEYSCQLTLIISQHLKFGAQGEGHISK